MMKLSEAAQAMNGQLSGEDATFESVTTDSRSIRAGQLFIALRGDRFDGHDYAAEALTKGAAAVVLERGQEKRVVGPSIAVDDTLLALGRLGKHWRRKFAAPVVGVTGSNGKTTVKEMLASVLGVATASTPEGPRVLATRGNLNNAIGVPLMLLEMRAHHEFAVIEMGMNHRGEISYLTRLAEPDVAIVNNAQRAHLEGLKTVEEIAHAKGEIYEGLGDDGVALVNADDAYAPLWRDLAKGKRIVEFGVEHEADVGADYTLDVYGSQLTLHLPTGDVQLSLQVPGMHNVRNAVAAAAVAHVLGVATDAIRQGLEAFAGVKGRLQRKQGIAGATFIDDSYNANPDSMKAAIQVLAAMKGTRIFVLGDMGELGPDAASMHRQIGAQAREAGLDRLYGLGDLSREAVQEFGAGATHFEYIEDLLATLENELAPDVTVLVKGSRFMQMERVVAGLTK